MCVKLFLSVSILISLDLALASQFQQPVDLQESHKAVLAWEENVVLDVMGQSFGTERICLLFLQ